MKRDDVISVVIFFSLVFGVFCVLFYSIGVLNYPVPLWVVTLVCVSIIAATVIVLMYICIPIDNQLKKILAKKADFELLMQHIKESSTSHADFAPKMQDMSKKIEKSGQEIEELYQ